MAQNSEDQNLQGRRLGRILTRMGKVTRDQVQEALALQGQRRLPIGQFNQFFQVNRFPAFGQYF